MKITIEVPDVQINAALESPNAKYWATSASWSPTYRSGFVVEMHGKDGKSERHTLGIARLKAALAHMAVHRPDDLARLLDGTWDGETGDLLLQLMAFGEVRYG